MRLRGLASPTEIVRLLDAVDSITIRTVLMLACGAGLHVSESCGLHIADIDGARMEIKEGPGYCNMECVRENAREIHGNADSGWTVDFRIGVSRYYDTAARSYQEALANDAGRPSQDLLLPQSLRMRCVHD